MSRCVGSQAAEALGVSADTFTRHVQPELPCVLIGSRGVFAVEALQQWLDDRASLETVPNGREPPDDSTGGSP